MSGLDENQVVNDNRILGYQVNGKPSELTPILQFNATTKSSDWVSISGGGMSSEQFYQDKIIAGDSFDVSGNINNLNDVISFVVPDGKTAFLIEAKITMNTNPVILMPAASVNNNTNDQVVAELKIDGIAKSKAKIGAQAGARSLSSGSSTSQGSGIAPHGESPFNVKMLSLVGDGVKLITIENVLDNGNAFAEMSGYLIDT